MGFSDLMATADTAILSAFGEISATIHFKDGSPDATVSAISKNPALEEDYVPGSTQGTSILLLFVPAGSAAGISHGSTASVSGVDYDIFQVDTDRVGAVTLRLRRRTERWDQ